MNDITSPSWDVSRQQLTLDVLQVFTNNVSCCAEKVCSETRTWNTQEVLQQLRQTEHRTYVLFGEKYTVRDSCCIANCDKVRNLEMTNDLDLSTMDTKFKNNSVSYHKFV